ncbi:MAG: bifunctional [glutamate--ammonia ligase]-adenylyl-L-tyrosine phosphorylase/[glutamate--ammonia-ligase] adenylyltransferase [Oceanococcaceae bacterium]
MKQPDYRFQIERLPVVVGDRVQELLDAAGLKAEPLRSDASRCLASSRFVSAWAARCPAAFAAGMQTRWQEAAASAAWPDGPSEEFDRQLRQRRNAEMVRLACRQSLGLDSPEATVRGLSALAEQLISVCVSTHWQALCAQRGQPLDAAGQPVQPLVFALGKLGGRELNFSSDVDLVFAHSAPGESAQTSADALMGRLVQRVSKSLSTPTADGFVYRVDLRLRPFGSQGAPSFSLAALDSYFEVHARGWERYAWQKARCIAGEVELGEEWLEGLKPFIYRRYIDFGQLASLRQMKEDIDTDVRSKGREQDIKRGWGGIREMEFAVQAQQLIHGGARPSLQQRSFVSALKALSEEGVFEADFAEHWQRLYWFLRQVENAWQAVDDAQTHVLPTDEESRQRLLAALGYAEWSAFEEALQQVRSSVRAHFLELFAPVDNGDLPRPAQDLLQALRQDSPRWPDNFVALAEPLEQLHRSVRRRVSDPEAMDTLYSLCVRLLDACADDQTAFRVLGLMEAISGRPNYVTMLNEHAEARRELLWLMQHSPYIAGELTRQPALLIELCHPGTLYAPPSRTALRAQIERQLAACEPTDFEAQLEQLRRIRHAVGLRIAAADVAHALPLMRVSDHLTELAEEIVRGALNCALGQMRLRWPELQDPPLAVVAYGKLGGMELSYTSDLDLVFLYSDAPVPGVESEPAVFYTRLVQKLINALATQTGAGRCYEVDMRLRPNGNSGLLVSSTRAFARYQQESAWTWEHQALVRARPITGDEGVCAAFAEIRKEVLQREREPQALLQDILQMREKMRQELGAKASPTDIKHLPSGLVDIEFYGQWLVLAHAAQVPALTRFADLLRILEIAAAAELLDGPSAEALAARYRALRACGHAQLLGGPAELPAADPLVEELLSAFYANKLP